MSKDLKKCMNMTKKLGDLKSTFVSVAKIAPTLCGAAVGIFASPRDSDGGPVTQLMKGNPEKALDSLSCNYIGYSFYANDFKMDGRMAGTKALMVGAAVSGVLDYFV